MKTKYMQVTISVLLLTGFFYFIDTNEIFFVISYSDKWSFFLACILSFCGNAACAFRWTKILNCESKMKFWKAIKAYFESISFTTVVPVGMLGGDLYRSVRLSSRNASGKLASKLKPSKEVMLSVLADRVHGFWALCFLAVLTIFYSIIFESDAFLAYELHIKQSVLFYLLLLIIVVAAPFLSSKIKIFFSKSTTELNAVNLLMLRSKKKITIFASVSSQIFFAVSFFLCLSATNVNISVAQCFIIVPIIFLFAALPLSLAGFGPREYSAAIILSFLGFELENSVASSILFGLTITLQGIGFLLINLIFYPKHR